LGFSFQTRKPRCFKMFIIWCRGGKFRAIPENIVFKEQVMMSKLLILSCIGLTGLMTACSVRTTPGTVAQPTVKASTVPQAATFPRQLPAISPSVLPVPTLIPPVSSLPSSGSIGGRPDPFSALPLTPTVVIKQNPISARSSVTPSTSSVPVAPSIQPSSAATAQQSSSLPVVNVPATVVPGATASSAPSVAPSAVLPAPASPVNLAQAIAVSGVVQAGSQTSVIVQVPNETTSRSAVVGDYLANGKVLVKRIEMQGAEPVVVLEQDGAEFVKPVGSGSLGTL
jgi:hypothetical protein